jgi:uncharacterized membrane protein HdeD (DUF308 family)
MLMTPLEKQQEFNRETAETISKSWWLLLLIGLIAVVAGIIILSINWTIDDLAVFIGAVFIFQGISHALTQPLDGGSRAWNIAAGLLGIAAGIVVIAWPDPSLLVVAIFLGCWLIVSGIFEIVGAISNRDQHYWWVVLVLGIVQVPLGLWALARPGLFLWVVIMVAGLWLIVTGITQCIIAFEVRNLPKRLDRIAAA